MLIRNIIVGVTLGIAIVAAPVAVTAPPISAASAATAFVAPSEISLVTKTPQAITTKWTPVTGASQYEVQISANADMSAAMYYRTTGTSANVGDLSPATTYYFRVRVTATATTLVSPWSKSISVQTDAPITITPISDPLSVATYNVFCFTCNKTYTAGLSWAERSGVVVQSIKAEAPDVIGLQEASQLILTGADAVPGALSQFEDLQKKLNTAGMPYKVTSGALFNCVNPRSNASCVYKYQGASHDSRIFYNQNTVDLIESGSSKIPTIDGSAREAAWAILAQKSTGKRFLYVNAHLDYRTEAPSAAMRIKQMESITAFVSAKNASLKIPVFIVGDFNSSKWALPSNGPYDVLTAAGYVDPIGGTYGHHVREGSATAEKIINANYASYNGLKEDITPSRTFGNGSHLDYIFTSKMRVGEWKMVLNNGGAGNTQVGVIPSDHNMITAKVELPASSSPLTVKATQLNGALGAATGPETFSTTGASQQYQLGVVLWSPNTGTYVSRGGILGAYQRAGSEKGKLGYPTSNEIGGLKDGGFYQKYQNGVIMWSPKTGGFISKGAIRNTWAAQGYENGKLGYPTSNEIGGLKDGGIYQTYQSGVIMWSPKTGARIVTGAIRTAYQRAGLENGKLGYPTSNEISGLKDGGVYQKYQGGVIMWSPKTGAHATLGAIRSAWAAQGYENGKLGYPTSGEYASAGGVTQNYQGGKIVYTRTTGARVIRN